MQHFLHTTHLANGNTIIYSKKWKQNDFYIRKKKPVDAKKTLFGQYISLKILTSNDLCFYLFNIISETMHIFSFLFFFKLL